MLYKLQNLAKLHSGRAVLDIDQLEIEAKKVYTLIGPNGAGKTTLLNILAFLDFPSRGLLEFHGSSVIFDEKHYRELRKDVVIVDQYPILFTGPVWKNIDFGLKIRRIPKNQRLARIKEVLELVGMENFADADAHRLSGGETKRIALARALAIEPRVLLCDEPTANVDTENQELILKILERCNREQQVSLIVATHYLSQSQRLADHTIILQNGRLSLSGRENIFPARCVKVERKRSIWRIADTLFLSVNSFDRSEHNQVNVYIDPVNIIILPENTIEGDSANIWQGHVRKAEKINSSVKITVACGVDLAILITEENYRKNPLEIGEEVTLRITAEPHMFS